MARRWQPSLNALRAFEAVARHLNYNLAAEELRVTPAAVKQLVYRLEEALDASLIERKGQGLALTRTGRIGLDDLAVAMRHMDASVEKMRGESRDPRLIVSAETSLATMWLVPRLDAFRAENPNVSVLIDSSQEIVDLRRSDVDVAIRYGVEPHDDLITYRLFDDLIFPACSASLASKLSDIVDLRNVPLIHWDVSQLKWAHATKDWFVWDNWLARIGAPKLEGNGTLHFNDYGQAVQAAVAGQGVVLASWPILNTVFETGHLVRPFAESLASDIGYDLATTTGAMKRPEVGAFVNWARGLAKSQIDDAQGPVRVSSFSR
jgi:LysR family glycine cleavage system transcriptional activator